ncbi:hypothetical protein [Cellulomonas sp. S1-8]|uniref:hypothetical protein n=1 Tax=Cellulomonas sp. S1-8 TaxID=2904790 RepID=UPI0022436B82|nr:hypothetical protein [Cellulomonas sp. S1-8]UZN03928.1 hypothetical protein OKX07_03015 [Cellulomonas sp. S1-8]
MSPTPFRRAAAVAALSVLALGGSALGAQAVPVAPPTVAECSSPLTGPTYTSFEGPAIEATLTDGTAEIVEGGLAISTTNGQVAFTDYGITSFPLTAAGSPSLDYTATSGSLPGLTMSYALDGAWAGTLVYEPTVYGEGEWWSTRAVADFDRAELFTLNELLAVEPDTTIIGVGFSLGSGATGAGTVHGFTAGCTTYAFDVESTPTPTPTPTPSPTQEPTPTPTSTPTPTPAPTQEPTPATVPVPALTVTQPTCNGLAVVPNGRFVIEPAPSVEWLVTRTGVLYGLSEDDVFGQGEAGVRGDVVVPPGVYDIFAFAGEGKAFGDLGQWQQVPDEDFVYQTITVTAFTGTCPVVGELTDGTKGGFTSPATVGTGGALVLSGLPAGEVLHAYLFSVPTDLGVATVAADGTLRLTIPASVAAGTHRVALYRADGTLLGWQYVEVLAAGGGTLAATGADPRAGIIGGLVLVAAGGALVLARRRVTTR